MQFRDRARPSLLQPPFFFVVRRGLYRLGEVEKTAMFENGDLCL